MYFLSNTSWSFFPSALSLVKPVFDRIHPLHHVPEIFIVHLVAFQEEVFMKEVLVAQRIVEKQCVKLVVEIRTEIAVEKAVETTHQTFHPSGVARYSRVVRSVHRIEADQVSLVVIVAVHLYVNFGPRQAVGSGLAGWHWRSLLLSSSTR